MGKMRPETTDKIFKLIKFLYDTKDHTIKATDLITGYKGNFDQYIVSKSVGLGYISHYYKHSANKPNCVNYYFLIKNPLSSSVYCLNMNNTYVQSILRSYKIDKLLSED